MRKTIFAFILALCSTMSLWAKSDCEIPVMVVVPQEVDSFAPMAQSKLLARMRQMVTANGMEGGVAYANFYMAANINDGAKEIMSGIRPLVVVTPELTLYVANTITGDKFAATVVPLKGTGQNEAQAYNAAISSINGKQPQLQAFIKEAREKIMNYYNTQTSKLISQAENMAVLLNYEKALALLASVPPCAEKYDRVADEMIEIYQHIIDIDGQKKLAKAQAIWNAAQDAKAAREAGEVLVTIDPSSKSWKAAQKLAEDINKRIGEEWAFYKEMQREAVKLEKERIEAIRDIGKAYGKNQKDTTINETVVEEKKPIDETVKKPIDEPVKEPIGEPAKEPADEPVEPAPEN